MRPSRESQGRIVRESPGRAQGEGRESTGRAQGEGRERVGRAQGEPRESPGRAQGVHRESVGTVQGGHFRIGLQTIQSYTLTQWTTWFAVCNSDKMGDTD